MKSKKVAYIFLALGVIISLLPIFLDNSLSRKVVIEGRVIDAKGTQAIPKALVRLDWDNEKPIQLITDENGLFQFALETKKTTKNVEITVLKSGFQEVKYLIEIPYKDSTNIHIVLRPLSSG